MRLGVVWLAALCGCNQLFGLGPTEQLPPVDAQFFDAPADAPFSCPGFGTPPVFSRVLHQVQQDCRFYTRSADWAIAECRDTPSAMAQGTPEGPFASIAGLEGVLPLAYENPQLAPEGDELFLRYSDPSATLGTIPVFRHDANHAWTKAGTLAITGVALTAEVAFGTPSRAPNRRMFVANYDISELREIEIDATYHAKVIATYPTQQLGGFLRSEPSMSPDGLRIVYTILGAGNRDQIVYGDRATIADRFTITPLPDVPTGETPFLTEDCSRLYFSAASSVLWIQRQ